MSDLTKRLRSQLGFTSDDLNEAANILERLDSARFLLVSMHDDGCGNPAFCADEAAVEAALLPLMFFLNPGEELDADHAAQFKANLAALLEDGFLNFEGDPSIHLYRLRATEAAHKGTR